jgi:hypothetical protein
VKKVRISLRDSKKKWSFQIYESLSSFIYLHEYPQLESQLKKTITLSKGEFLEIEWLGSDYSSLDLTSIFLDGKVPPIKTSTVKCDNIKVGKCTRKSGKDGFDYITGFSGWVSGNIIPWYTRNDESYLKVIELKGRNKPRINFKELFKEEPVEEQDYDPEEFGIGIC